MISTSLRPPSNVKDSLGTPRGLHQIAEKHGAGSPPGIVFNTRVSTGRHYSEFDPAVQAKNLITSRIAPLAQRIVLCFAHSSGAYSLGGPYIVAHDWVSCWVPKRSL